MKKTGRHLHRVWTHNMVLDDSCRDTLFGKHEHGAMTFDMRRLRKHLLIYLLTYFLTKSNFPL